MKSAPETREAEETASRGMTIDRWLAVSQPLAIDDDPEWNNADAEADHEGAA